MVLHSSILQEREKLVQSQWLIFAGRVREQAHAEETFCYFLTVFPVGLLQTLLQVSKRVRSALVSPWVNAGAVWTSHFFKLPNWFKVIGRYQLHVISLTEVSVRARLCIITYSFIISGSSRILTKSLRKEVFVAMTRHCTLMRFSACLVLVNFRFRTAAATSTHHTWRGTPDGSVCHCSNGD